MARTCLFELHQRLGGRMVDFHGWGLPVQYEGILAEHRHCRTAAALFDTSHMGRFRIRGPEAAEALARTCTQNAAAMAIGQCRYGFLLNEAGGIRDDTILARLGDEDFLLVVNADPRESDLAWLREHVGDAAQIEDQTASWGKVDLQGPASAAVLAGHVDADLSSLGYFRATTAHCIGRRCVLSRTGYTGELGYEILAPQADLPAIAEALLADERVRPAGLGARDSLRLEMGYPLYGQDIDEQTTPIEASLERFVRFDHEFVGAAALRKVADERPARRAVAFRAATRRRASTGDAVLQDGREVGRVTSGGFAPSLEVSIGLAFVPAELAEPPVQLTIRLRRGELAARVCDRPVYGDGTCRANRKNMENTR